MSAVAVGVSHPAFRRGLFFPFLHFYKFGGLHFLPSLFIFLFFSPLPPPLFFIRAASSERQKALLVPYRFDSFTLPPANVVFSLSRFPFSEPWFFPSNPPPWRPFLLPQTFMWAHLPRPREPAELCRNARAHFGAARPSGRRRFPGRPPHSSASLAAGPPLPAPLPDRTLASPGIGTALPVRGGPWQCFLPETFLKLLGENYRFVCSLFRRFLVTKWQWAWIFPGFSWDARDR